MTAATQQPPQAPITPRSDQRVAVRPGPDATTAEKTTPAVAAARNTAVATRPARGGEQAWATLSALSRPASTAGRLGATAVMSG